KMISLEVDLVSCFSPQVYIQLLLLSVPGSQTFCLSIYLYSVQTGIQLVGGWLFLFVSQVLDGAGLDVDFHLLSPKGETLVFDERKSDGVHTVETEDGDYMFCFDNTFSTISEKVIFFELILDNMGEDGQEEEDWKKYVTGTDLLDMKLEDILESINSVKARLSKSVQIQTLLRAFEARDRNIQESNFDRVNFWSMVNLGVMVVVSAVQVYMLKSLFEDKRKSRT
uniref:Transmembrane p24 trafficking protein 5 n=1 Tax=Zonotrichia albicollis TaxID=44394 RepID=A0A8D2MJG3_ZONAL